MSKNTFTSLQPNLMCKVLMPVVRKMDVAADYVKQHKGMAAAILASGPLISGLKLGPMVATALRGGAGALALGSTGETFAAGDGKNRKSKTSIDQKIKVSFHGYNGSIK